MFPQKPHVLTVFEAQIFRKVTLILHTVSNVLVRVFDVVTKNTSFHVSLISDKVTWRHLFKILFNNM
jgi:hypothetical protein